MSSQPFFIDILKDYFKDDYEKILNNSLLLKYLEIKTRSVDSSSKSRANYGNLYAIYVLVKDYVDKKFDENGKYSTYEGARFVDLFVSQRKLPFGSKLQNHSLNNRCNEKFRKFFGESVEVPILRDHDTKRYRINEKLLIVTIDSKKYNIAKSIISIIDRYIAERIKRSTSFLETCLSLEKKFDRDKFTEFIKSQLTPNTDARIFEIVSYVILKNYYSMSSKILYKTGKTNANDGGIDFVMKPDGRFFQATEVMDFRKYFLDIDKINRFPITFVVKTTKTPDEVRKIVIEKAKEKLKDDKVINKYNEAIEEIITLPILIDRLEEVIKHNKAKKLLKDLIVYYKMEFNIE